MAVLVLRKIVFTLGASLLCSEFSPCRSNDSFRVLVAPYAEIKEGSRVGWRIRNSLRNELKGLSFSLIITSMGT